MNLSNSFKRITIFTVSRHNWLELSKTKKESWDRRARFKNQKIIPGSFVSLLNSIQDADFQKIVQKALKYLSLS